MGEKKIPQELKNDFNDSPSISERRNGYAVRALPIRLKERSFTAQVGKPTSITK